MAKANQICACIILLVLMFSYAIFCAEARSLKSKKRGCKNYVTVNGKEVRNILGKDGCKKNLDLHRHILEQGANSKPTAEEGYTSPSVNGGNVSNRNVDDLRPTSPGHSPGAGHSTGPSRVGPNF